MEITSGCFSQVFSTLYFIPNSLRVKALLCTAVACSVTSTSHVPVGPCWDMKVPTGVLLSLAGLLPPLWRLRARRVPAGVSMSPQLSKSRCKLLREGRCVSFPCLGACVAGTGQVSCCEGFCGCPHPPLLFAQGAGVGALGCDNASLLIKCSCCLPARSEPGRCSASQCAEGVGCSK